MTDAATEGPLFDTVVIIGVGLIGSHMHYIAFYHPVIFGSARTIACLVGGHE